MKRHNWTEQLVNGNWMSVCSKCGCRTYFKQIRKGPAPTTAMADLMTPRSSVEVWEIDGAISTERPSCR